MMKILTTELNEALNELNEILESSNGDYLIEGKTKINLKKLLAEKSPEYLADFDVPGKLEPDNITMDLPYSVKEGYVAFLNQFSRLHIAEKANEPENTVYHIHHINLKSLGGGDELENLIVLTAAQHHDAHTELRRLVTEYAGIEPLNDIVVSKIKQAAVICDKTKNTYTSEEMSEIQILCKLGAKASGGNVDTLRPGRLKEYEIVFDTGERQIVFGYDGIRRALNIDISDRGIKNWLSDSDHPTHNYGYKSYGVSEIIRLEDKNEGIDKPVYIFQYDISTGKLDLTITQDKYYANLKQAAEAKKIKNPSNISSSANLNHNTLLAGSLHLHSTDTEKNGYVPVWASDLNLLNTLLEAED